MPNIYFHQEDIPFSLPNETDIALWIAKVINLEHYTLEELNIIFSSDEYLHGINITYLNHDTYTDIITFDQSEQAHTVQGDIFISIPRVMENAEQFKVDFEDELHRVVIHGVLHLMGYKDKTPSETTQMRKKEEASLSLRFFKETH